MYKIRKKQNYFSKDHNVELRCEKIIQIKGCEKFENDRQNDRKNDRRSRSDRITFFALSDRDLIEDYILPSDRDLIRDYKNVIVPIPVKWILYYPLLCIGVLFHR